MSIDFHAARVRILALRNASESPTGDEHSLDFSPSATYIERLRVRLPAQQIPELIRTVLEESK